MPKQAMTRRGLLRGVWRGPAAQVVIEAFAGLGTLVCDRSQDEYNTAMLAELERLGMTPADLEAAQGALPEASS
jgi:hypothetical protein